MAKVGYRTTWKAGTKNGKHYSKLQKKKVKLSDIRSGKHKQASTKGH